MSTTLSDQHLTEGELIRALDAQLEADERDRVVAHLSVCSSCQAELERARHRKHALSALLLETDFDIPVMQAPQAMTRTLDLDAARARRAARLTTWQHQPWLRVAAAIALLLSVTFAIPPVRAAIVDWVRTQFGATSDPEAAPVEQPPAPTPPAVLGPRVAFTPESSEFLIDFEAADPTAALSVRRVNEAQAITEASSPAVELLSLPGGVRIRRVEASGVKYTVVVPRSVIGVTVRVAGATRTRLSGRQLDEGMTLTIGPDR